MAADDESLLDVFINVKPDEAILAATEGLIDNVVSRIREKFTGLHDSTAAQAKATAAKISQIQVGGGGSGSGRGRANQDQADQFREAARAAEDLVNQSRQLNVVLKEIGSVGINQQFETAANELKRIQTEIKRNSQDNDVLGLEGTLRDLDLVTGRFRELQVLASQQRSVRDQFNQVVSSEQQNRGEFRLERQLASSLQRGLPSGEVRQQIAQLTGEIRKAEFQFDRLVKSFDGSPEHLERLIRTADQLKGSLSGVSGRAGFPQLDQDARTTTRSINALGNNAYQMGQAFEDAAVGFSLNGIAGAVRGASNNVTFLIQNLVQAKIAAAALTKTPVSPLLASLPLYTAIGAAIGLLVVGPLADWLESLNDIETKTKDITAELQRSFKNTDFKTGIGIEESDLRRSLFESEGLEKVIDALKRLNSEAENGKTKIREMLSGFEEDGGLQKIRDSLRETTGLVTDAANLMEEQRNRTGSVALFTDPLRELMGPFASDNSKEAQKALQAFGDEIGGVVQQIETARLNSLSGIIDEKQLAQTEKKIFNLTQKIEEFTKTADLADEKFGENLKGNLEAVNVEFEKMRDISREVASQVRVQFNDALEAGARKTEELRDRLDIIRSTVKGIGRENSLFLEELSNVSEEYSRQINSSTLLTEQQKKSAIALERQSSLIQLEIREVDIREQLFETEKKIESVREKSRKSAFINLDSYLQKLQVNALTDEDDPQTKQLNELKKQRERELAALAQGELAQDRIRRGREFGDIGVPFRDGRISVPDPTDKRNDPLNQMLERQLIKGFFDMTDEQKKTTDAVKKLELGARAG